MRHKDRATAGLVGVLTMLAALPAHASYYANWVGVPDFDQRRWSNVTELLCDTGKNYCGPTTGTDWLAFVSSHGFPVVTPVPPSWQNADLDFISSTINHEATHMTVVPTTLCQAGTSFGKVDDGLRDHLNEFAVAQDLFSTVQADNEGSSYITPYDLYTWMAVGGMVSLGVGWYAGELIPNGVKWTESSGHFVALASVADKNDDPQLARIWINDPGSESNSPAPLFSQSPFTKNAYSVERKFVTIRHKFQLGYDTRYQYMVNGYTWGNQQGFLDSFTALIGPLLVSPSASAQSILYVIPKALDNHPWAPIEANGTGASAVAKRQFSSPFTPTELDAFELHPFLPGGYARTTGRGGLGKLWYFDPVRGAVALADTTGRGALTVGRRGRLFASTGSTLDAFDWDRFDGTTRRVASAPLGLTVDALSYDEATARVVALSARDRVIAAYDEALTAQLASYTLSPAITLPASPSLRWDPSTRSFWLAGANSATIVRLRLDDATRTALAAESVTLPSTIAPTSLNFTDGGRLVAFDGRDAIELTRDANGRYQRSLSPIGFAGHGAGPFLRVVHSRSTQDPNVAEQPTGHASPDQASGERSPQRCEADLSGAEEGSPDGVVNQLDYDYFMRAYNARAPRADLDNGRGYGVQDRRVDEADLRYFLAQYNGGCR